MPKRVVDFRHVHPGSGRTHTHFKSHPSIMPGIAIEDVVVPKGIGGFLGGLVGGIIGAGEAITGIDVPFVGPGDRFFGGGGGPQLPQPHAQGIAPCVWPMNRQADGSCRFDLDPDEGTGFPLGNGGGFPSGGTSASGLSRPTARSVVVQDCPTFADGKKGLLWMNALTGEVVCLPRGTNGSGFGLIRKNKPRAKPFISAAMKKQLGVSAAATKKAKEFAKLTGQVCESKSARAARNARGR